MKLRILPTMFDRMKQRQAEKSPIDPITAQKALNAVQRASLEILQKRDIWPNPTSCEYRPILDSLGPIIEEKAKLDCPECSSADFCKNAGVSWNWPSGDRWSHERCNACGHEWKREIKLKGPQSAVI